MSQRVMAMTLLPRQWNMSPWFMEISSIRRCIGVSSHKHVDLQCLAKVSIDCTAQVWKGVECEKEKCSLQRGLKRERETWGIESENYTNTLWRQTSVIQQKRRLTWMWGWGGRRWRKEWCNMGRDSMGNKWCGGRVMWMWWGGVSGVGNKGNRWSDGRMRGKNLVMTSARWAPTICPPTCRGNLWIGGGTSNTILHLCVPTKNVK